MYTYLILAIMIFQSLWNTLVNHLIFEIVLHFLRIFLRTLPIYYIYYWYLKPCIPSFDTVLIKPMRITHCAEYRQRVLFEYEGGGMHWPAPRYLVHRAVLWVLPVPKYYSSVASKWFYISWILSIFTINNNDIRVGEVAHSPDIKQAHIYIIQNL